MTDPEPTIASEQIYRGRVVGLRVDTVRLSDGRESRREIVEHPGAVCMVPVDDEDRILLVRQYRKAVGETLLEIPAGTRDAPSESAEECAQRELIEETGCRAGRIERLGRFYSAPGFCTEVLECFLMYELTPAAGQPDFDEEIRVERYRIAEVVEMACTGKVRDAKSISGIMLAMRLITRRQLLGNGRWRS